MKLLLSTILVVLLSVQPHPSATATATAEEANSHWVVLAKRINLDGHGTEPIVSSALSQGRCKFPYNAAMFPDNVLAGSKHMFGSLVRCQNLTKPPYDVTPSVMCSARINKTGESATQDLQVVFEAKEDFERCGTEDPRVALWNGTYFLFYTAYDCNKAALALATTTGSPFNASSWVRHGVLFPQAKWSKSGAAIFSPSFSTTPTATMAHRAPEPGAPLSAGAEPTAKTTATAKHHLLWGDSSIDPGLHVATSSNGLNWTLIPNKLVLPVRADPHFDSALVEAGPPPLPLSHSNHLFFLYNSARKGFPSPKPGYDLQYNVGFAVLNASDPSQVLQRSSEPLLSPSLEWEIGNTTEYLTPNVVFVEGMLPAPPTHRSQLSCPQPSHPTKQGRFIAIYGAADSALGSFEVLVCAATP